MMYGDQDLKLTELENQNAGVSTFHNLKSL